MCLPVVRPPLAEHEPYEYVVCLRAGVEQQRRYSDVERSQYLPRQCGRFQRWYVTKDGEAGVNREVKLILIRRGFAGRAFI